MRLKLLDANKAAVFGLPQQDCEFDEATKILESQGWSPQDSVAHVNAAIMIGAYEPIGTSAPKRIDTHARIARKEQSDG